MISELIQYIATFIPLNDTAEKAISSAIQIKHYEKGTLLLREGEISSTSFFNLKGCVRSYYLVDGEEKTTFFYTEKQFITSMRSFSQKKPATHFLQCIEDCTLALIPFQTEIELLEEIPELETFSRIILEEELGNYQEMLSSYIISNPEQRYIDLLKNKPHLIDRIPQYYLASYLGILPESLSRIRKRLTQKRFLT